MAQLSGNTERTMLGDLRFAGGGMSGRFLGFENWDHDADPPYQVNTIIRHRDHLWWASSTPAADDEPGVTMNSAWQVLTGGGSTPVPTPTPTPTTPTFYIAVSTQAILPDADAMAAAGDTSGTVRVPSWTGTDEHYVWIGVDDAADDITAITFFGQNLIPGGTFARHLGSIGGRKWWRSASTQNRNAIGTEYGVSNS